MFGNGWTKRKMKKVRLYSIALLIALMSLGLIACGQAAEEGGQDATLSAGEVVINGCRMKLDDDISVVKAALGEEQEYSEVKSCLYDGFDKTFGYGNCSFITYPQGEKDYISSITISSAQFTNPTGVDVGDSTETIESVFAGKELDQSKVCYLYENAETQIGYAFYLDGDQVSEIEIYKIVE